MMTENDISQARHDLAEANQQIAIWTAKRDEALSKLAQSKLETPPFVANATPDFDQFTCYDHSAKT